MPIKCGGCAKFLSPLEAATCCACEVAYHRACVALRPSGQIKPEWTCPECKKKLTRKNNTNTPVKGISSDIEQTPQELDSIVMSCTLLDDNQDSHSRSDIPTMLRNFKNELHAELGSVLREEMQSLRNDFHSEFRKLQACMAELRADNDKLRAENENLKQWVQSCTDRMSILEQKMSAIETQSNKSGDIDEVVAQLKRDLNDRDQQLLATELELTGLPEHKGEDLPRIVKVMATEFGMSVEDRDIVSVGRVGGLHLNATSSTGPVQTRPRIVVVRLARRELRDELMRSARVRRNITTVDIGLPGSPRRFFVNERLTKANRQLFRRARDEGRRLSWRFVWTKNGRIFVRRKDGEQAYLIRTEAELLAMSNSDAESVAQSK